MAETLTDLGDIVADMVHRCGVEKMLGWEKILRLHIRPKPSWMPLPLWHSLVNMVVTQSEQKMAAGKSQ